MNELCLPYLFDGVNLIEKDPDPSLWVPIKYGKHIRSLRVLVDPFVSTCPEEFDDYQQSLVQLLRVSPNLSSIALYYRESSARITNFRPEIASQLERGVIKSLGAYCVLIIQDIPSWSWPGIVTYPVVDLLTPLMRNPGLTKLITHLDRAMNTMGEEIYDFIRIHFTALESLTIRGGLRWNLGRL